MRALLGSIYVYAPSRGVVDMLNMCVLSIRIEDCTQLDTIYISSSDEIQKCNFIQLAIHFCCKYSSHCSQSERWVNCDGLNLRLA